MGRGILDRDGNASPIQGFTPRSIQLISAGSVNVSDWTAFCFPEDDITYQINGAGQTATIPSGTIRVVDNSINTITFSGFAAAKCEIM